MQIKPSYVLCKKCKEPYEDVCKPCHIAKIKSNFSNWTSENEKIDKSIQEIQLNVNSSIDILFEWIPYSQFSEIKKIGEGGFATVYSAIWKDGPIRQCNIKNNERKGNNPNFKVALKYLHNSENITDEFLNEVKAYSFHSYSDNILQVYGISKDPNTKDYVMVLQYAEGGNFNDWLKNNYEHFNWNSKLTILRNIIYGFKHIHSKNKVHRDFHGGNVLLNTIRYDIYDNNIFISDMGLSGEVGTIDQSKVYGVMPFTAPEVLRGEPYTQHADIYSFGMFMYLVATEIQPFVNQPYGQLLAIEICNDVRPKIDDKEIPECYSDLMKRCWDPNPLNRPTAAEIFELISLFQNSYTMNSSNFKMVMNIEKGDQHKNIETQFKKVESFRKSQLLSLSSVKEKRTDYQAISRVLSPIASKFDNTCCCSVEFTDFTKVTVID